MHLRTVLLRDDIHAYERPSDSFELDAPVGPLCSRVLPYKLFRRDTPVCLSEGDLNIGIGTSPHYSDRDGSHSMLSVCSYLQEARMRI